MRAATTGHAGSGSRVAGRPVPGRPAGAPSYRAELVRTLRVVLVGGLLGGVVIGLLLRIAMLLLRLASPDAVGLTSDDGFEIGRVTLFGVYNLIGFGVLLGCVGAAAYVAVAPFLVGPTWLQRFGVALTAMLLGGTAVVDDEGIDFNALDPELAVALFLAVPFVSGLVVAAAVELVDHRVDGWPRWLPALILLHPALIVAIAALAAVVAALLPARRTLLEPILASPVLRWVLRLVFLLVPVLAGFGLVRDLDAVLA